MANPTIQNTVDSVTRATTVMRSATVLVNGIGAMLEAAKAEALANGATPAELEPVQGVIDVLNTEAGGLATAVAAHTVAENEPQPPV